MAAESEVDILIIGGGLTGASLLLALKNQGLKTKLVETASFKEKIQSGFDSRSLALAPASVAILNQLGIWPGLKTKATPIDSIHISEQKQFGRVLLQNSGPLGFVVEMHDIMQIMQPLLPEDSVLSPAELIELQPCFTRAKIKERAQEFSIKAKLIVAADGGDSLVRRLSRLSVRQKNYGQTALTANIGLTRSHGNRAFERFTPFGPLAMLPLSGQRASLVWALPPERAQELSHMPEAAFLKTLQQTFGYRLGRLVKTGQRSLFPLRQILMPKPVAWPLVFIGNAAHTLHPVAGQGFNLGLRDVACLAQCILQKGLDEHMLNHYAALRQPDFRLITGFTDKLAEVFTESWMGLKYFRSLGFLALDNLPFVKKSLIRHASGFTGIPPDLACAIPLCGDSL